MAELTTLSGDFDRTIFESLLKRRLFYTELMESTELPATLTAIAEDYGPPGFALQSNIVDLWRKHFVLQEDMLELYCTILTPEDDIFNSIKSFINGKET